MTTLIHPTAVIDPGAELHPTVKVGPYAIIGAKVKIAAKSTVGAHVVIDGWTEIGEDNRIFPGAAIGIEPQDLKYDGSLTLLKIGDRNSIREYVTINRATRAGEATIIGDENLLMAYSHVGHNCVIENQVIIANSVALAGHIHIESRARISGMLGIHQFVRIGCLSMIGGMTRVDRDVPPYMMLEGNPARIRALNLVGLQRAGFQALDNGRIFQELKQAFRLLYRSGLPLNEVLEKLEHFADNEHVQHLRQFLVASSQDVGRRGPSPGQRKLHRESS